MNAVYDFAARLEMAKRIGSEKLAGGELDNKQFNDFVTERAAARLLHQARRDGPHAARAEGRRRFGRPARRAEPGLPQHRRSSARSGCCTSTRWSAARTISPIKIADAQKNSGYWQATEAGTPNTALFFLKAAQPDRLKDAPGGDAVPERGRGDRSSAGKVVFADTCARCHSSKRRRRRPAPYPATCAGAGYLDCFKALLEAGPRRDEFKEQMSKIVARARLPDGQLPVDRRAHPGDAAAHQRLQPAGDQCARRQHLGQLLVAVVQAAAVGRHGDAAATRSPASRCPTRCRPAAAATRACRR